MCVICACMCDMSVHVCDMWVHKCDMCVHVCDMCVYVCYMCVQVCVCVCVYVFGVARTPRKTSGERSTECEGGGGGVKQMYHSVLVRLAGRIERRGESERV